MFIQFEKNSLYISSILEFIWTKEKKYIYNHNLGLAFRLFLETIILVRENKF